MTALICSPTCPRQCYHAKAHECVEDCGARICHQRYVKCVPAEAQAVRVKLEELPRFMGEHPTFAVVGLGGG